MGEPKEEYFGDLLFNITEEESGEVSEDPQDKSSPAEEPAGSKTYRGFFETLVQGPKKELTLSEAVRIAVTPRVFFSKRLAPPFTVCNARVFCESDYLLKSDIVIPEAAERLKHVADIFGVTLEITYESDSKALWSSDSPTMWLGGNPYGDKPVPIASVIKWATEVSEAMREQWEKDHTVNVFTSDLKAAKKPKSRTKMTYKVGVVNKKKSSKKKTAKKAPAKKKKKGRSK